MEMQRTQIHILDHMYIYIYIYFTIYSAACLYIQSISHYTMVTWQADGAVKIEDKEFSLVQAQEQRAVNAEQRRTEEAPTTNKFHQVRS